MSNQLAAFAAVMLFASTQVSSPDPEGAGLSTSANLASHQAELDADAGPEAVQDTSQEVTPQAVSVKRPRARGLNLSLFLFNR